MAERYFQHTFPNGLTLLAEQMPGMQSAAMTLMLPAGSSSDPDDKQGSATVLADLILRGAGERDNRALTDYLDSLGLQRSSGVGVHHTRLGCAALAAKVIEGLGAYADIVQRPHLPEHGFDSAKDLALQALAGLDDDPRHKLMIKLREWAWPSPYGRNTLGEAEHLKKLSIDRFKGEYKNRYHANGAIISFAGKVDFNQLKNEISRLFGDFRTHEAMPIKTTPRPASFISESAKSEQTHIGISYPTVNETDPGYYIARMAVEILSGGMSGRLFTEVREKRGLCYSVGASYSSLKHQANIMGYAGTSNERAQATLDCFIAEILRLSDGVTPEELARAKTGVKANTIMQGESTSARAGAIAHDFFMRGRIRTLDEIKAAIDSVNVEQVNAYLKANKPSDFTVVIVGPKELKVP